MFCIVFIKKNNNIYPGLVEISSRIFFSLFPDHCPGLPFFEGTDVTSMLTTEETWHLLDHRGHWVVKKKLGPSGPGGN